MNKYHNMTVWILAGNDINFSLATGLIRLHMPSIKNLVCNENVRLSPYSPCHSLAPFMGDSTKYCWQKQHQTINLNIKFVVNVFYCDKIVFNAFTRADIIGVRSRVPTTASLDDDILVMGGGGGTFLISPRIS